MVQIGPAEQIRLVLDLIAHPSGATINHDYCFRNNHLNDFSDPNILPSACSFLIYSRIC